MKKVCFRLFLISLFFLPFSVDAASIDSIPDNAPANGIYAEEGISLPNATSLLKELNQELSFKEDKIKVGIVAVHKMDTDSIETFANQIANKWKDDYFTSDKGLLFVFSIDDHRMRIETTNSMRAQLTDSKALEAMQIVKPSFKKQDYDRGVTYLLMRLARRYLELYHFATSHVMYISYQDAEAKVNEDKLFPKGNAYQGNGHSFHTGGVAPNGVNSYGSYSNNRPKGLTRTERDRIFSFIFAFIPLIIAWLGSLGKGSSGGVSSYFDSGSSSDSGGWSDSGGSYDSGGWSDSGGSDGGSFDGGGASDSW